MRLWKNILLSAAMLAALAFAAPFIQMDEVLRGIELLACALFLYGVFKFCEAYARNSGILITSILSIVGAIAVAIIFTGQVDRREPPDYSYESDPDGSRAEAWQKREEARERAEITPIFIVTLGAAISGAMASTKTPPPRIPLRPPFLRWLDENAAKKNLPLHISLGDYIEAYNVQVRLSLQEPLLIADCRTRLALLRECAGKKEGQSVDDPYFRTLEAAISRWEQGPNRREIFDQIQGQMDSLNERGTKRNPIKVLSA